MMTRPVAVVTEHRCARHHVSPLDFARCVYPAAVSIYGDGRYASLSCTPLAISLWPTLDQAIAMSQLWDDIRCVGYCRRDHQVVELAIEQS